MMRRLKEKLNEWLEKGLIAPAAAEAILEYEQKPRRLPMDGLQGFLIAGAFALSLGALALVAANWSALSVFVRFALFFSLMAGVAFAALRAEEASSSYLQPLLLFFMSLVFAGLGLIWQTYNSAPDFHAALALWSLAALPLALCSRPPLPLHAFIGISFLAFLSWPFLYWPYDFYDISSSDLSLKFLAFPPLLLFTAGALWRLYGARFFPHQAFKEHIFTGWAFAALMAVLLIFDLSSSSHQNALSSSSQELLKGFLPALDIALFAAFAGLSFAALKSFAPKPAVRRPLLILSVLLCLLFFVLPELSAPIPSWLYERISSAFILPILSVLAYLCLLFRHPALFVLCAAAVIVKTAFLHGIFSAMTPPLLCFLVVSCHALFSSPYIQKAFRLRRSGKELMHWAGVLGAASLFMWIEPYKGKQELFQGFVLSLSTLSAFAAVFFSGFRKSQKTALSALLCLFVLGLFLFRIGSVFDEFLYKLLSMASGLSAFALAALLASRSKGLFILCITCFMARIFCFYFESWSLSFISSVLLITGLALVAASRLFEKNKAAVQAFIRRMDE